MANFDWKTTLRSIAPTLATAIGGPLAGAAVAAIGSALGMDAPTVDTVTARLAGATADDLLKLKQAEYDFKPKMEQQGIDVFALEVKDRDSARVRDTAIEVSGRINWARWCLTAFSMLTIVGLLIYVMKDAGLSEYAQGIVTLCLGRLLGYLDNIFSFEFGTTRSNQAKDATIQTIAKNG